MIRAGKVFPASEWSHVATDAVVLDFEDRHRRRVAMVAEGGLEFLLDLPEAVGLRDGDGLLLDDGRIVEVRAAPEPLADIVAPSAGDLLRLAWHLGNRHLPAQLFTDRIRIRQDHVIEAMVRRLGATVTPILAPFDPEGGAYGLGYFSDDQDHDHHHHDDDHDHHGREDG